MNRLEVETRELMRKYGVVADKKLGQNFLINEDAILESIRRSNVTKDDLIIEIGPGLGTLTKYLIENAGKVIAVELDRRMLAILNDRFSEENNFEVIYGDILRIDLEKLIEENNQFKSVKVIANLPYYITTPIIMKLLEEKLKVNSITIMVQKEVADRIVAVPGNKDFGVLTLSIEYYAKAETIVQVKSDSFIPAPKVDSSVVMLNLNERKQYDIRDEHLLFKVIKGGFAQRRKMFFNSIESSLNSMNMNKTDFKEILKKYNIDETRRAETLSLKEFIDIANEIYDINFNKR